MKIRHKKHYKKDIELQKDLEFSTDSSLAILYNTARSGRIITWIMFVLTFTILLWSVVFEIDETVRAQGKAVPIGHTQVLQSRDGGTIESLKAREGEQVKKGEVLITLCPDIAASHLEEGLAEYSALLAKQIRLRAQLLGTSPIFPETLVKEHPVYVQAQYELYQTQKRSLNNKIDENNIKLQKAQTELSASVTHKNDLANQLFLLKQEKALNEPLVKKGAVAKTELLKLDQQIARLNTELNSVSNRIPLLESEVTRLPVSEKQIRFEYTELLQKELALVEGNIVIAYERKSQRELGIIQTKLKAPVDGIVQKVYINTIGGIAKPGEVLMDIVPIGEEIMVETKVDPKDIGFIQIGLPARIRISAYDFSIYGALNGIVSSISADTVIDKYGHSFYTVAVRINQASIDGNKKNLPIIPGMQATVDISITRSSILHYIFKPALKLTRNTA